MTPGDAFRAGAFSHLEIVVSGLVPLTRTNHETGEVEDVAFIAFDGKLLVHPDRYEELKRATNGSVTEPDLDSTA